MKNAFKKVRGNMKKLRRRFRKKEQIDDLDDSDLEKEYNLDEVKEMAK